MIILREHWKVEQIMPHIKTKIKFSILVGMILLLCGCVGKSSEDSLSQSECDKICQEILLDTAELPCEDIFAENCTKNYEGYLYTCNSVIVEADYLQYEKNTYVAICSAIGVLDSDSHYPKRLFKITFTLNEAEEVEIAEVLAYDEI